MTREPTPAMKSHRWFAAVYDRMSGAQERGALGRMRRDLLSGLQGDVLEIGAGTGANFEHYPPGVPVVATDPDEHMLKRARRRLDAMPGASIELRQAPAERLPFDPASFDAVVSTLVLCTVDDPQTALGEIRRVLRRGGELRFLEHVRGAGMLGRAQDVIEPLWGWCSAGCHPNRHTEQALRDAGFEPESLDRRKLAPWMPAIAGVARVAAGGVAVPRIVIAATPGERDDGFAVRIAVFVNEQGISREDELDDLDATAVHCVGYVDGTPVAAGRLIVADDHAKIGRMAVLASHRGRGLGALVLQALEQEGVARGVRRSRLSAQLHARGFYERCGYKAFGDVYDDVGIPHIDMEREINAGTSSPQR